MDVSSVWTLLVALGVAAYVVLVCVWMASGRSLQRRIELRTMQDDVRRLDRRVDQLDRRLRTSDERLR